MATSAAGDGNIVSSWLAHGIQISLVISSNIIIVLYNYVATQLEINNRDFELTVVNYITTFEMSDLF